MRKLIPLLLIAACIFLFSGCEEISSQVETMTQEIDVEAIVTEVLDKIDWEELKNLASEGYDTLTEKYPALKSENVKAFLKENGLKLMNTYLDSTLPETQEKARKLGEIIKILYPDLTDEVNAVIGG